MHNSNIKPNSVWPIMTIADLRLSHDLLDFKELQPVSKSLIWPNVTPRKTDTSRPPKDVLVPNPKLKLFDQCREVMRFNGLAYRTEQTYLDWIRRYVVFCRAEVRPPHCPAGRHHMVDARLQQTVKLAGRNDNSPRRH